jgi:hypothetical protein
VKKKPSPEEVKLLGAIEAKRARFERWYRRLKRAFTALEKCRRRLAGLRRRLARLGPERSAPAAIRPIDQAERLRLCAHLLRSRDPDAVRALCALYRAAGYGRLAPTPRPAPAWPSRPDRPTAAARSAPPQTAGAGRSGGSCGSS